ncbi:lycopene cyclase domain-containing protein [Aestuariimicrobium soli]|uniref:lycopene cyclase domain-containing protein n=1 Tax=Aestuariimicrobium soli TaxID=2035834 RepID=UPI003EB7D111
MTPWQSASFGIPEYTLLTVLAVVGVVAVELLWLRTGLFRSLQYWLGIAIVFFFQALVDGWLTKLSDPIVLYNPAHHLGLRVPWDIPVEDFGFGWAMVTLTLLVWTHLGRRRTDHRKDAR